MGEAPLVRAHEPEDLRREEEPGQHDGHRRQRGDTQRLRGRFGRALAVLLADTARHHGRHPHGEPDGNGIDQRDQRLGEPHRGHGRGAQAGDEEHVHHGEDALHECLQHHGHAQQEDGAVEAAGGEVLFIPRERLAQLAVQMPHAALARCGWRHGVCGRSGSGRSAVRVTHLLGSGIVCMGHLVFSVVRYRFRIRFAYRPARKKPFRGGRAAR